MRDNVEQWEIEHAAKRSTVNVLVFRKEGYFGFGGSFATEVPFEGTLDSLIAVLTAMRDSIPKAYRATAEFHIQSETDYDGHVPIFDVGYVRPETDAEWAARRQDLEARVMASGV